MTVIGQFGLVCLIAVGAVIALGAFRPWLKEGYFLVRHAFWAGVIMTAVVLIGIAALINGRATVGLRYRVFSQILLKLMSFVQFAIKYHEALVHRYVCSFCGVQRIEEVRQKLAGLNIDGPVPGEDLVDGLYYADRAFEKIAKIANLSGDAPDLGKQVREVDHGESPAEVDPFDSTGAPQDAERAQ